jgi:hypothetical protein
MSSLFGSSFPTLILINCGKISFSLQALLRASRQVHLAHLQNMTDMNKKEAKSRLII